jgi:predicted acyl esterase
VYAVHVSLINVAFVLNKGHAFGVHITASNAPRYSANPNNCAPLGSSAPPEVAEITVHTGPDFPTSVTLPVVPLDDLPHAPTQDELLRWFGAEQHVTATVSGLRV